ncbi:MAG TPA: diadenylate cyclase CdaA [Thermoanaerobaculia bacterium]|nr:diadenylate cyclase CdaA [Thermoanaerobaculia bacterium]
MNAVVQFLQQITWRDGLDVLLVAVVIYNLLLLIRGTRAVQVVYGILVLVAVYYLARLFDLLTLQTALSAFLTFLPFAIIVLFQDEIRRALAQFGSRPIWGIGTHHRIESVFHEVVLAATAMSARRVGALIVLERMAGLKNFVDNGIRLDAVVSYDLLLNIFNPHTPLHDGAVIVQGDRLAAAACYLPLTRTAELSKEYGTRHRAALGISEETDAVAVVVSEETGRVSVAYQGTLIRDLDSNALRNTLYKLMITDLYPHSHGRGGRGSRRLP